MKHLLCVLSALIFFINPCLSQVKEAIQQGATESFLNTFDAVKNAKEAQKREIERRKQKNPSYSPPRELGVPYLGIEAGYSRFRGEHIGLKAALMGYHIFGGLSKEFIFNNHNEKKLWYAGVGYYFGDPYDGTGESSLDITVGNSPLCNDVSIEGSLSLGYFFDRSKRFGVKGTLGVGAGNLSEEEPNFIWDIGAGLIVKIFAD